MKRSTLMLLVIALVFALSLTAGVALSQEEEEAEGEGEVIEIEMDTDTALPPCRLTMQQMGQMTPGMGQMPGMSGMMGTAPMMRRGLMGRGMGCCGMPWGGMPGCGMGYAMGRGMGTGMPGCAMGPVGCGMRGACMMCGSRSGQLCRLGCPCCLLNMAQELKLSEEQTAQLKEICSLHRKDAIRKQADIKIAQMELNELIARDPVDFTKVKAKLSQLASMREGMSIDKLTVIQKARKVLTEEQLEMFSKGKMPCSTEASAPAKTKKMKKIIKVEQ